MSKQIEWENFEANRDKYRMNLDELRERLERKTFFSPFITAWYRTRYFITGIPNEIKFAFQRLTKGYDDSEIWGLHYAITKFVYPRIKEFARWQGEHGRGVPLDLANDPAEWLTVLNKIARAFEIMAEDEFILGEDRFFSVPNKADYGTQEQYTQALEHWHAESDKRNEEVKEGLALFGKYFQNLWD